MNKLQLLQKDLTRQGVVALIVVAVSAAVFFATDYLASLQAKYKEEEESALRAAQLELDTMQRKIDQSTVAGKHYADLMLKRPNAEFSVKNERLLQLLRNYKAHYRLGNAKLNLVPEKLATQPELSNPTYEVMIYDDIGLEFDAISDLHALSFIADFMNQSPGLVHVKSLAMERKGDLNASAVTQLLSGQTLANVAAKLQFTLISVQAKPAPSAASSGSPAPANPGGKP